MNNKALPTKIKIIIIIAFTIVLFGLILLIFGRTKDKRFESYSSTPYDEHIGVILREVEKRQSTLQTGSSSTKTEGEHEKSVYDLQILLVRNQENDDILAVVKSAMNFEDIEYLKRLNACDVYYLK